jgi:predicted  nucleic acid-binding Zn-ribbon protein
LEFEAAAWRARDSEHEAECRAHAATVGRNQELQRQITDLQGQLERARSDFAAELEKGRLAIAAADERAAGVQRHALREMEQERTARARSDKQVEALRGQVGELERRHGAQEAESAAAQGQLRAELSTAHAQAREHAAITESARTELDRTQQMLIAAQQEAIRFRTEALTLRELVERFRPAEKVERPKKSKTP